MSEIANELPQHLSASSIQTYIQCPLKFKLSRVDKIQEPPTIQTLLGNFVHDALEYFYKNFEPSERTVVNAKQCCTFVWNQDAWAEKVSPYLKKTTLNDFKWSAVWCVENLFLLENPSLVTPTGLEYEVFGEIDGVLIKGFIDRWLEKDGLVVISDYKTGKTPAPKYMADKWFQLNLYALLLTELEGKQNFELELLYLKDGVKKTHTPSPVDFETTRNLITSTKKEILFSHENNKWSAIPSNLCNWCFYKSNLCTYWNPQNER